VNDERGKITGVIYFDKDNHKTGTDCDIIVISASATETPRLLLNSKSKQYPAGVGNRMIGLVEISRDMHTQVPSAFLRKTSSMMLVLEQQ